MSMATAKQTYSRRQQRQSERRDVILDVAQAAFLERGFAATTMSGIAARLGGSKSTLWTYFRTKQSLLAAVLIRAASALEGQLFASLNLDEGIEQSIHHFCEVYARVICSPKSIALHRLVIAEGVRFPEVGQTFSDCAIANTRQMLITFLTDAHRLGKLTIPDPPTAADLLLSLCHGNTFQSLIFNVPHSRVEPLANNDGVVAAAAFLQMFRPDWPSH
ncbi:AcrR family transcriptional regulator [Novosphingobium hassiacum]|uniref:AcrR family transcriptional regulator n=2 Tax=Novosphingobium hassiacum TaxID=173676 RepID=A0A7W5ZZG9_9SPHN|nr:AcrR family transcriptional regulator [Novosphingobium hassiacum]